MKSQSIKEANEQVKERFEDMLLKRNLLRSMLDDPDDLDENSVIKTAEERTRKLEERVAVALRDRGILRRLGHVLKRSGTSEPIARRARLSRELLRNSEVYNHTSTSLSQSDLGQYGFASTGSPDGSSKGLPASLTDPCFVWKLQFKTLSLSDVKNVWREMRYDENNMLGWWRSDLASAEIPESDGWSDMKRLARRVVVRILEAIKVKEIQESRHVLHLRLMAEKTREIVLYQIAVCYRYPDRVSEYKPLLEHTVPIVYLISDAVRAAQLKALTAEQNDRIEANLQCLEPYVREIRDRCYILGVKLGFKAGKFIKDDDTGGIFDFGKQKESAAGEPIRLLEMDTRLAGANVAEFERRMGNIDEKQLKVKESIRQLKPCQSSHSIGTNPIITEQLDGSGKSSCSSVLESYGVQELKDIACEGLQLIGSGGYADVYVMNQDVGSRMVKVAVKRARPDPRSAKRIEREVGIWAGLNHKHILPLLGFVLLGPAISYQPCLVSTLCHADLKQFLKTRRELAEKEVKPALTETRKMQFLRDIMYGLDYLHAKGISHGDLRAANVLVTNDLIDDDSCYAVLIDFGMAAYTEDNVRSTLDKLDLSSINQVTNQRWLAPELFASPARAGSLARVTQAGDVYAFGVVYLEVIYEKNPYEQTKFNIEFAKLEGELPATEEELHPASTAHWSIMRGCWQEVDKRWSIYTAGAKLLMLLRDIMRPQTVDYESLIEPNLPEGFTQYTL